MVVRIASRSWATYMNQQRTDNIWLELAALKQLGKRRDTSRSNMGIVISQHLDEQWKVGANCITKFGYVSESATH